MDDRTRIENAIKAYWHNGGIPNFRLSENEVRSIQEGEMYKYSEITTGQVTENGDLYFIPMARDYWNSLRCVPIEEMEPSSFWQMYNKMCQSGFYNKVAKHACLLGIGY